MNNDAILQRQLKNTMTVQQLTSINYILKVNHNSLEANNFKKQN